MQFSVCIVAGLHVLHTVVHNRLQVQACRQAPRSSWNLLQLYPGTKAIIDHMGFCKCHNLQSEEWQRLLGLAKYPQVVIYMLQVWRCVTAAGCECM
jgi:predicted TIM-barrel fold metal-dependent hydrolase